MDGFEELKNRLRSASPQEVREIISSVDMPPDARQAAENRLEALSGVSPDTGEYEKAADYLSYLAALPWNKNSGAEPDIQKLKDIINAELDCSETQKNILIQYMGAKSENEAGTPKVMVVDDERIALESLEYAMEGEGYDVDKARNGSEAIEKLRTHKFDVIITDLIMGEVDGNAILEEVKKTSPLTKVVMVTGYATVDTAVEAMRRGAFHYIEKPLRLDELKAVVGDALRSRSSAMSTRVPCLSGRDKTARASIIEALAGAAGRHLIRISLDEITDEAGLIGESENTAGPGIIAEELIKAGVSDPLFMMEGIDTAAADSRGDLVSALTDVIFRQKNHSFTDRYLGVPFDLSGAIFTAAADNHDNLGDTLKRHLEIIELL